MARETLTAALEALGDEVPEGADALELGLKRWVRRCSPLLLASPLHACGWPLRWNAGSAGLAGWRPPGDARQARWVAHAFEPSIALPRLTPLPSTLLLPCSYEVLTELLKRYTQPQPQ